MHRCYLTLREETEFSAVNESAFELGSERWWLQTTMQNQEYDAKQNASACKLGTNLNAIRENWKVVRRLLRRLNQERLENLSPCEEELTDFREDDYLWYRA